MRSLPQPSPADARDAATFDALMWALARPGLPRVLPEPGMAAVALALVDRECRVFTDDPALAPLIAATGAQAAPAALADHAFLMAPDLATIASLPCGSALYPDQGATMVLAAPPGPGAGLRLTGPGVDGALALTLAGLSPAFWALRARLCRYPAGIDILLIDGARVTGLPRSTLIEVL